MKLNSAFFGCIGTLTYLISGFCGFATYLYLAGANLEYLTCKIIVCVLDSIG